MRLPHLLGNERLKAALHSARFDSFGSAALLEGPAGVGKRTAARDIAMGLLCRMDNAPCQVCPACRQVLAGTHPDMQTLLPLSDKKSVTVEQVRALRAKSFIKPGEGETKVFVIPDADKLNAQSQNALLKVLEEPQETVFLLLCENRQQLLPTVRSRCRSFFVLPLSLKETAEELVRRGYALTEAEDAAARSGGVLGRAIELLEGADDQPADAAQSFVDVLDKTELQLFETCLGIGKLSRDEYDAFCNECCRLLAARYRDSGEARMARVYEYIQKQQLTLMQNPSVPALAGALAAFCAAR